MFCHTFSHLISYLLWNKWLDLWFSVSVIVLPLRRLYHEHTLFGGVRVIGMASEFEHNVGGGGGVTSCRGSSATTKRKLTRCKRIAPLWDRIVPVCRLLDGWLYNHIKQNVPIWTAHLLRILKLEAPTFSSKLQTAFFRSSRSTLVSCWISVICWRMLYAVSHINLERTTHSIMWLLLIQFDESNVLHSWSVKE